MGQQQRGIRRDGELWVVDKKYRGHRLRQRFASREEAESWVIKRMSDLRQIHLFGERPKKSFESVAAHYLRTNQSKLSIVSESYLLQSLMPYVGHFTLPQLHDASLAKYVADRLRAGRSHKTINSALALVRRILNLSSSVWRDENGLTWLEQPPKLTLLPLAGYQREPRPITWSEQKALLDHLPPHLARMTLFAVNTCVRDDVVCNLRWAWEIRVPELNCSVFEVPRDHVKGRRRSRVVICNAAAQDVVETVRGQHDEFVFVYSRPAGKTGGGTYEPHPVQTMNNNGWQRARREIGITDLHVHDLRHTTGMRLREAGVHEATIADILWHSNPSMTRHYSMAQIVELHSALEKIKEDSGRWNKSLATLRREHEEAKRVTAGNESPPKITQQRKQPRDRDL
jgi:integrase